MILPFSVKSSLHPKHNLSRGGYLNPEWSCEGKKLLNRCFSEVNGNWTFSERFHCKECNFDLCHICVLQEYDAIIGSPLFWDPNIILVKNPFEKKILVFDSTTLEVKHTIDIYVKNFLLRTNILAIIDNGILKVVHFDYFKIAELEIIADYKFKAKNTDFEVAKISGSLIYL